MKKGFKKICNARKFTFISDLKHFEEELPSDWFLSDHEILLVY